MTKRIRCIALTSTVLLLSTVEGLQGVVRRTTRRHVRPPWQVHQRASETSTSPSNATASLWSLRETELAEKQTAEAVGSSLLVTSTPSDFNLAAASDSDRSICFGGVGRLYSSIAAAAMNGATTTAVNGAVILPTLSKQPSLSGSSIVLDRLKRATVVVVGVGGVGSWAAEALGRSGVGTIVLVDLDDVCRSNINRQLHALHSTVGQMKVDVLRDRLLDINPTCNVTCVHDFVSSENICSILDSVQPPPRTSSTSHGHRQQRDLVVLDAMDGGADKAALVAACVARKTSLVVCGGAAGRTDPTSVSVGDLTRVQDDRLLQSLRRNLRRHHGFPEGAPFRKKQPSPWKIPTVHSTQKEVSSSSSVSTSSLRRCDSDLGTACFVTGSFGFAAAGCVVDMIATDKYKIPYVRR